MSVRRTWHIFQGWCTAHGVRPLSLNTADFLNLVDYFAQTGIIPETETPERVVVVEEGKDPPPAWMGWKDNSSQHDDMLAAWEARNK